MKTLAIALSIGLNLTMVVVSNLCFRWSAHAAEWREFLGYQVAGNLAGFVAVLALTFVLRHLPLNLAYSLTAGLGFVLVQVVASRLVLGESVTGLQWAGVTLIVLGIILVFSGKR
jgi:multidrug transporter EmrE-like cation transporter